MVLSHFIIHTNIFISPCISNLLMFLEIILVSISSYLYFYLFRASFSTIWFDRVLENLVLVILSASPPWRLTLILLCDIDLFVCKKRNNEVKFPHFPVLGGEGSSKDMHTFLLLMLSYTAWWPHYYQFWTSPYWKWTNYPPTQRFLW